MDPRILEEYNRRNPQFRQQTPQLVSGNQTLPSEQSFAMENPLTQSDVMSRLQLSSGGITEAVDPQTLTGWESTVKMSEAGSNLVKESILLANSAPVNKLPAQAFLREIFIEGTVIRKMAHQLPFLELANRQTTSASEIVWFREQFAPQNDPELNDAGYIDEGSTLPLTVVSNPIKKQTSTGKYGLGTIFTDRAMRNTNSSFNEVSRKLDFVTFGISKQFNTIYAEELSNRFDLAYRGTLAADDQVNVNTVGTTWDDPSANPFEDIRDFALEMEETDEYFYSPTDLWVPPKSYKDLVSYATQVDHDWVKDPTTGRLSLQVDDIRITKLPPQSGVPDGNGLLLARGAGVPPPLDVWDEVDTRFTRSGLLHVQRIFDEHTLNTRFNMWRTFAVANRNPKSVGVFFGLR